MRKGFESSKMEITGGRVGHTILGWLVTFLLLFVILIFVWSFWGVSAFFKPWWVDNVLTSWNENDQVVALWLVVWVILGMMVPAALLYLSGLKLTDVGMRMPNTLGWRMIILGIVVSIPFGILLLNSKNYDTGQNPLSPEYMMTLLSMIPEHFLVTGVCTALMLPGRRLPSDVSFEPVEGNFIEKGLRWFGLAQISANAGSNRILDWFGLTWVALFAIVASGAVFRMIHLGKDDLELMLSFPGGVAIAYMTIRSHSVWPSVVSHWSLNLIPLGIFLLFK
ncbi:MAG: CPBP family intramembrane glutamic endopeptidase [Thermodesulfobacteriota bacterium]